MKIFLFHQIISVHVRPFIIYLKMHALDNDQTFNQQQPYPIQYILIFLLWHVMSL